MTVLVACWRIKYLYFITLGAVRFRYLKLLS